MDTLQLTNQLSAALNGAQEDPRPIAEEDPFFPFNAVELLQIAVIVKYGPNRMEAAFKFIEETSAIMAKHGLSEADKPPTLPQKLAALKDSVGEEMFNRLLANPEVERMGARALRSSTDRKANEALNEVSALFNHSLDPNVLSLALKIVSSQEDQVGFLATY